MFEQTFVNAGGKTNKTWTVLLSFAAQILVIVVAILIPMIYFDAVSYTHLDVYKRQPLYGIIPAPAYGKGHFVKI